MDIGRWNTRRANSVFQRVQEAMLVPTLAWKEVVENHFRLEHSVPESTEPPFVVSTSKNEINEMSLWMYQHVEVHVPPESYTDSSES